MKKQRSIPRKEGDAEGLLTSNTNNVDNGNLIVLWLSMKTLVNFIRHLTSIKLFHLAYLTHEPSSQQ